MPQLTLESKLIELGASPRILSTIEWEAGTPPGTQTHIRTRTGDGLKEEIHYFIDTGQEVIVAKYRKLLSFQKGDSTVSIIPAAGWSNWSKFYLVSGSTITSPSSRR